MRRPGIFILLFCATAVFAGPIAPGVFNGQWSVTNKETDLVTSGPLSIVYRETGRPLVYLWEPVFTQEGIYYIEHHKPASTPSRRSLLWNVPRFARLHGEYEAVSDSIAGSLRFHSLGFGAFAVERYDCTLSNYNALIPQ